MIESEHRVAEVTLPNGTWISTVKLPDNTYGLEFETMVFQSRHNLESLEQEQYTTSQRALDGHKRMVAKWAQS